MFEDTKFVTENFVWERINKEYDTFCTNDVFRIYHNDSPDSLGKALTHGETRMISRYRFGVFCINELWDQRFFNKNVIISAVNVGRAARKLKKPYKQVMNDLSSTSRKVFVTAIGYPLGALYSLLKDGKKG